MDGKRAVVTLYPLSLSDPIPYRSLTFTPDSDHIEIGRASKREAKNLAPTNKNGLFDSRVMSRNHANIRACLDKKVVFISDGGSMHGTRLNGKKLPVDQEVPIKTGDQVVFGTEVTRGHDTYPPLENKPASTSNADRPKVATNTFCVPDDDDDDDNDDDVQVIGKPAPVVSTVDSSSGSEEGTDDGSVVEISSPKTTPLKDIDGEVRGGSQQTPIEVDNEHNEQPLATPRMTPSSNEGAIADADRETRDQLGESSDSEPDSMLDYSEGDLASQSDDEESESDEESMSDSSFESDIELSDADGYSVTVQIPSFPESRKLSQADDPSGKTENAICHSNGQGEHAPGQKADGAGELLRNRPRGDGTVELPEIRGDAMSSNPQTVLEPVLEPEVAPKPNPSAWSSSHQLYANTHLHLQPYGKIFDHSLTGFHSNSYGGGFPEWPSRGSLPVNYQYAQPRNELRLNDLPLKEIYRPDSYYRDGPFARQPNAPTVAAGELGPRPKLDTNAAATDTTGNGGISDYYGGERNAHSRPDTRLRISDIVSLPQIPPQKPLRKRKVADMEENSPMDFPQPLLHDTPTFDYNASQENQHVGTEPEESSLPDAQPQLDPSGTEETYTQLTTIDATKSAPSIDDLISPEPQNERPSKRPKTSEASMIRSHAATAVVSAMIGAVGTVALLASLPSDYFI
ncbi:hypothetical protein N8T08_005364 [Aspergillus melleus]|uniref:Uncharacterized protein n=1 Tax=Aspergillus melleus TaxID=138277 RepID=A0ACC3B388_9EURO|nr:hypothetical protein N8T08_005364 [Aspergillus melleus]